MSATLNLFSLKNQPTAMKTKNNQPQPSKATFVLPLAKAWWKRNPQANLLDIESAIQKIAEAPVPNGKQSHDAKKGNSRR